MMKNEKILRINNDTIYVFQIIYEGRLLMRTMEEAFIRVEEIMQIMGIGQSKAYDLIRQSKAYDLIRQCNEELEQMGFLVIRGRCPRKYFEQKIYGLSEMYNPEEHLDRVQGAATVNAR